MPITSTISETTIPDKKIKNSNSELSIYLNEIKEIIEGKEDNNEDGKREAQLQIEKSWIKLIEDKLSDDKILIERKQGKVLNILNSVKETLLIYRENKVFNRRFPKLNDAFALDQIDYVLITYSTCLTLYQRLSYNALAIKVGEQILDYIYNSTIKDQQGKIELKENILNKKEFFLGLGIDLNNKNWNY